MKANKYQKRFYRDWVKPKGLYLSSLVVKETDLHIITDKPADENYFLERVIYYRRQVEDYISKDKRFQTTLKPLAVENNAPLIVKGMADAAKAVNVGPMAAVAGGIAQFLGEDILKTGFSEVIIENGGDIYLRLLQPRKVKIYSGGSKLWNNLSLIIKPEDTPIGICSSSGKIGHSLSFGSADNVSVIAKDALLADAAATAVANLVKSKKSMLKAADFSRSIKGVNGAVIIFGDEMLAWGNIEFCGG